MQSRRSFLLSLVSVPIVLAACGSDDKSSSTTAAPGTTAGGSSTTGAATTGAPTTAAATTTAAAAATTAATAGSAPAASNLSGSLRLGYFPNITHAPALVGVQKGIFAKALGDDVTLETSDLQRRHRRRSRRCSPTPSTPPSSARTRRSTPTPSRTARRSGSSRGATSGGAFLVVKPEINTAADLKGKTIATPQLGNTQDVALRTWLKSQGLKTDTQGGGDVSIMPQDNADHARRVQAAATSTAPGCPSRGRRRLVQEGGGKVLVDESDAVARGQVRHHPPDRRHEVPRTTTPTSSRRSSRASSTRSTTSTPTRPTRRRRPTTRSTRSPRSRSRTPSSPRRGRTSTFTARPDRLVAADESADNAERGRPARRGRPEGHLRPRPAQRGAARPRASRR